MYTYLILALSLFTNCQASEVIFHAAFECPGNRYFDKEEFKNSLIGFNDMNYQKESIINANGNTCFVFIAYDDLEQATYALTNAVTAFSTKAHAGLIPANVEFKILCDTTIKKTPKRMPIPGIINGERCSLEAIKKDGTQATPSEILASLNYVYSLLGPAFE